MKLSIVLCTTNDRSERETCALSIKIEKNTELIVVNNSTHKLTTHAQARIINDPTPGLSHARNTGWKTAKGEYIAFIDDDAIATRNWVNKILTFIKNHPQVEAFGGQFSRYTIDPIPAWMPLGYGTKDCGHKKRQLIIGREFLNGTNMIFKRSLLKKMGGFNTTYGMVGKQVFYGEETELQLRLAQKNIPVWYDPAIKVSHFLPKRKMNFSWLIKEAYVSGQSTEMMMRDYDEVFISAHHRRSRALRFTGNYQQKMVKVIQLTAYMLGWYYQKLFRS